MTVDQFGLEGAAPICDGHPVVTLSDLARKGVAPVLAALYRAGTMNAGEFKYASGMVDTRELRRDLEEMGIIQVEDVGYRALSSLRIQLTTLGEGVGKHFAAIEDELDKSKDAGQRGTPHDESIRLLKKSVELDEVSRVPRQPTKTHSH